MSSFATPSKPSGIPNKHFGDKHRRVAIALPRSLQDLLSIVSRRYPRMVPPITLFRNEGATEPLTEETYKDISKGDVLIAFDAGGTRVPLGGGPGDYTSETSAQFQYKQSPPAKPILPKDDRKFISEYTQEFTNKELEMGEGVEKPKFRIPKDERDWITESRAQFTDKKAPVVDPYKTIHQTESEDTPLTIQKAAKDDRDWMTESSRAYVAPTSSKPAAAAFDPYQQHNLSDKDGFIFPSDDRSFVTEAQAQFIEREIEPVKPVPPLKNQYMGTSAMKDDRSFVSETKAKYVEPEAGIFIWLEPDYESSEVSGRESERAMYLCLMNTSNSS